MKRSLLVRIAVWWLVIVPCTARSEAQEVPPPKLESAEPSRAAVVRLMPGMHRHQFHRLLGEPDLESIIGSMGRVRAVYDGSTEIIFLHDRAVALRTGYETRLTDGGSVAFDHGETTVIVDPELLVTHDGLWPSYDPRAAFFHHFWYAGPRLARQPYDGLHFTPAAPYCLLQHPYGGLPDRACRCDGCRRASHR